MPVLHIIHISKTGGTALRAALAPYARTHALLLHGHETRLSDIPPGEKVAFGVRDPVSRFVSGFNSRLRRGRPRYDIAWTAAQAEGFARFPTPGSLAEALATGGQGAGAAKALIAAIPHTARGLTHWLDSAATLHARRADIALIWRQEDLAADFVRLTRMLRLPEGSGLPTDAIAAHRTPDGFSRMLSPAGEAAIRAHYAEDALLIAAALELRAGA